MLAFIIAIFAAVSLLWKLLPKLLHCIIKDFLSRDPTFGFRPVLTLRDTAFEGGALRRINAVVGAQSPLQVKNVHVGRFAFRFGPTSGLKIALEDVAVDAYLLTSDAWREAESAIRDHQKAKSSTEASAANKQVRKFLSGKAAERSLGAMYKVVGYISSKLNISVAVAGVKLTLVSSDDDCMNLQLISLQAGVTGSDRIESGGYAFTMSATVACEVSSVELVQPVTADVSGFAPKLATILTSNVGGKKQIEVSVKASTASTAARDEVAAITMTVQPQSVALAARIAKELTAFSEWRQSVETDAETNRMALSEEEVGEYTKALARGRKKLSGWEERLSTAEILSFYARQYAWPLPEGLGLEEWIEQLSRQQSPLVGVDAKVSLEVGSLLVEVDTPELTRGDGIRVIVQSMTARASGTLVPSPEAPGEDLKAEFCCSGINVQGEADETFSRAILDPVQVSLQATASMGSSGIAARSMLSLKPQQGDSHAICVNVSGRTLWKCLNIASAYSTVMPEASKLSDEEAEDKRQQARRLAHTQDVKVLFRDLDKSANGSLTSDELHALIGRIYGDHMIESELQEASDELFQTLDTNQSNTVTLDELSSYFASPSLQQKRLLLRYWEYARPLPSNFDILQYFADTILLEQNPADLCKSRNEQVVYQKRWVRALGNFEEAKRSWEDVVGPALKLKTAQRRWLLSGQESAVDFWNDPYLSVRETSQTKRRKIDAQVSISLPQFRVCFAASQHWISVPRVFLHSQAATLAGSVHMDESSKLPRFEELSFELAVSAECFNSRWAVMEPLLEPLTIVLSADSLTFAVKTESYAVLNVTPSMVRTLKEVVAPLERSSREPLMKAAPSKYVGAVVVCNLPVEIHATIIAEAKGGEHHFGPPVTLGQESFQKGVPVLLPPDAKDDMEFHLEMSNKDSSRKVKVKFSDAGIYEFQFDRKLLIFVEYSPTVLAPIVTLGGLVHFRNNTAAELQYCDVSGEVAVIPPFSRISMPPRVTRGELRQKRVNEAGYSHIMDLSDELHSFEKVPAERRHQQCGGHRLHVTKLAKSIDTDARHELIFVPVLRVLNALPVDVHFSVQLYKATDLTRAIQSLVPGSPLIAELCEQAAEELESEKHMSLRPGATEDVMQCSTWTCHEPEPFDVNQGIILAACVSGVHYVVIFPKRRFANRKRALQGYARAVSVPMETTEHSAPGLDVMVDWRDRTVLLTIHAKVWVMNKSGWNVELRGSSHMGSSVGVPATKLDIEAISGRGSSASHVTNTSLQGNSSNKVEDDQEAPSPKGLPIKSPAAPEIALLRAEANNLHVRAVGISEDVRWNWDARSHSRLAVWPKQTVDVTTAWSHKIGVEVANTTSAVSLWDEAKTGFIPDLARTGIPDLVFGVHVTHLPAPFNFTKLVTLMPRYVLRNGLGMPLMIWPRMSTTKRAPQEEDRPTGLPTVKPGASLRLDSVPDVEGSHLPHHKSGVASVSLGVPATASASPRHPSNSGGSHVKEAMDWSMCVALDTVGDTVFTLGGSESNPGAIVRATVQLVDATLFILLNRTQWPYCLENRSSMHTIVFRQKGADDEYTVPPLELKPFALQDLDLEEVLVARVQGAGAPYEAEYYLKDLSNQSHEPMYIPGTDRGENILALEARLHFKETTCVLAFSDPVPQEKRSKYLKEVSRKSAVSLDIFSAVGVQLSFQGFHITFVDSLARVPVELLCVTVDYVTVDKPQDSEALEMSIHHCQVDDMTIEDMFVFGPSTSGFNSCWLLPGALARTPCATPFFSLKVQGPRDPESKLMDTRTRVITIDEAAFTIQPIEVNLNVQRLIGLALTVATWVDPFGSEKERLRNEEAQKILVAALPLGIRVPPLGAPLLFNIAAMQVHDLAMNVDIVMGSQKQSQEGQEDDDSEDAARQGEMQRQIGELVEKLPGAMQTLAAALFLPAGALADVSPRIRVGAFGLENTLMSAAPVVTSLQRHYTQQLLQQWYRILGSVQVLGDPASLVNDVGGGVSRAFMHLASGEIASGVYDLLDGVVAGVFSSVSKATGVAKEVTGGLLGKPLGTRDKAHNLEDGVDFAMVTLTDTVSVALDGVLVGPTDHLGSSLDFLLAVGKGGAGILVRPLEGSLGAIEKVSQGIEGSLRFGGQRYYGLRRPPRASFRDRAASSQPFKCLSQGIFWPSWTMKVFRIHLPSLWQETTIRNLVLSLGLAAKQDGDINVYRSEDGYWIPAHVGDAVQFAHGRVGALRGPFQLKVDAELEGNVGLTKPVRTTVGKGALPAEVMYDILHGEKTLDSRITFKIEAVVSWLQDEGTNALAAGELLGEVTVEFARDKDLTILPKILAAPVVAPAAAGEDAKTASHA